ncbi:unnamed protein product [Lactuca virosa]|uniref:HAT C-terminal dimerisation domain-containing protein n=1 Tax=Lactuca virosa TaxID=75947 RepID=A0AAU9LDY3_9ASTR|nr:unnamed protein product [Lactuca virosa]
MFVAPIRLISGEDLNVICANTINLWRVMADTNNTNPLDVNDGSDDSVEEIGSESVSQGVESTSTKQRKKRKKKTSDVWRSFEMLPQKPNEPLYCKCKKCGTKYQAESKNGTGSSQLKKVEEALFSLFDEYMQASRESSVGNVGGGSGSDSGDFNSRQASVGNVGGGSNHSMLEEFDEYDNDDMDSTKKSQLQVYLLEPRTKRTSSINILEFWQSQQYRYPELAKLAMNILCVPVSTVASESTFSLGGRVLNEYQSSMKPDIVEAVICSRDWLFGEKVDTHVDIDKLTQNVMDMNIAEDKTEVTSSNKL